jgi:hypothetical protein
MIPNLGLTMVDGLTDGADVSASLVSPRQQFDACVAQCAADDRDRGRDVRRF